MEQTDEPITGREPRARTLTGQRFVNRLVRGLLRTPLLGRLVGRRLITIYVVGRVSGRKFAIPVAYTRENADGLLIGTPFRWVRNLRSGETVDIRLRGRRRPAEVRVFSDEADVVAAFAIMARDNHNFAKFNSIGLGADGEPDAADLRLAWKAGARAVRLRILPAPRRRRGAAI